MFLLVCSQPSFFPLGDPCFTLIDAIPVVTDGLEPSMFHLPGRAVPGMQGWATAASGLQPSLASSVTSTGSALRQGSPQPAWYGCGHPLLMRCGYMK